jgi:gamma-glutamylputrescine oxidase
MTAREGPTWYDATAGERPSFPPLAGDATTDVCIIGAGFTGLSAALHLAERGLRVVLLESKRVGTGGSGRNGGQIHSGQRRDVAYLAKVVGREDARRLWDMAEEAKRLVRDLIKRHAIDCDLRHGLIAAAHDRRAATELAAEAENLARHYDYHDIHLLSADEVAVTTGSPIFAGGWLDRTAGHLHPLRFALGLARAAAAAGARIHESTPALRIEHGTPLCVATPTGAVRAGHVLIASDAYGEGLSKALDARVLPIASYIVTTPPLPAGFDAILPGDQAASDTRFIVRYWRRTADRRLLFGGAETFTPAPPRDIAALVRKALAEIYPQLGGVPIDHAWGGTIGITRTRLPYARRLAPSLWVCGGYSGHGVALAPLFGKIMAEAIAGTLERYDLLARLPVPPFPGGRTLRAPLLAAALTWHAMLDRI